MAKTQNAPSANAQLNTRSIPNLSTKGAVMNGPLTVPVNTSKPPKSIRDYQS